jgi:hypothetical protein
MCCLGNNLIARKVLSHIGETIWCQELLGREMRKLGEPIDADDGDQT